MRGKKLNQWKKMGEKTCPVGKLWLWTYYSE